MKPPIFLFFGLFMCLIIITGCQTTSFTEGPAPGIRVDNPSGYSPGIRMNSVAILDDSLQQWYVFENSITGPTEHGKKGKISVENTNSRRSPTGTLEVWAVLRNRTDHDLQVQGRVQFFDLDKAPAEGPTAWKRIYLPANSVSSYKEFSTLITNIGYYYVEIREGR